MTDVAIPSREAPRPSLKPLPGGREVSFRLDHSTERIALPPTLWTDLRVEGDCVCVRTLAPAPLLRELCRSASDEGVDLPEIVVLPTF